MLIAKVVGSIWATRKEESLQGYKLLIVKQIDEYQREIGEAFVAVDTIGAGVGELVIVTTGSSARKISTGEEIPVDAAVVGIVDSMDVK
ncbi:MAG: EutN/CcmL family microcompartment protein [Synergistetes bacterium]|nr:EutN/CcmL family microcompartment protein [Synergistota bacterium]MCX8127757.1 EutN/CcmL family microcompartment protein [Synergistota bacterium]MDW8191327.1 EutN/CcmL family microcompartment protein [Synergistota bacterium]